MAVRFKQWISRKTGARNGVARLFAVAALVFCAFAVGGAPGEGAGGLAPAGASTAVAGDQAAVPAGAMAARDPFGREPRGSVRVAAVGDIACPPGAAVTATTCRHADVARSIVALHPKAVLLLGDIQYDRGEAAGFQGSFGPSWAKLRRLWHPVPGNHDYVTPGASGYYGFFGAAAHESSSGYYSYNLGSWHVVALNSNCDQVACGNGSAQLHWLKQDLARNKRRCVAAYLHHPRFSTGEHGDQTSVAPFWRELRRKRAELVLSGHDHDYERFAPQDENGVARLRGGVRQFVVGTGGKSFYKAAGGGNSERVVVDRFGSLALSLRPDGYAWSFVDVDGAIRDRGHADCH